MRKTERTASRGSGYKAKDFRLRIAQMVATAEIKKIKPPQTGGELRAKMMKVATSVAKALDTAPRVALSSYINPDLWRRWKNSSRTSGNPPSAVVAKTAKVENLLADLFRARWKAVGADFARGIEVAKTRAHCFLAYDRRTRLRLAKCYYNPARAARFANSSTSEIVELCWAWFTPFQAFAHTSGVSLSEIGAQLEALVGSEYVAMTWGLFESAPPPYTESAEGFDPTSDEVDGVYCYDAPHLYPLPDLTTECGDVYEAIVYAYCGQRLKVCKSIAGPFIGPERAEAIDEIERAFLQDASEEGDDPRTWSVNFRRLDKFLPPDRRRSLIEAEILGNVGSPEQDNDFELLREEMATNGSGYLKRSRARIVASS